MQDRYRINYKFLKKERKKMRDVIVAFFRQSMQSKALVVAAFVAVDIEDRRADPDLFPEPS